jgi:hypothetical protein
MWQGKIAAPRTGRQAAIFFGKIKLQFWGNPRFYPHFYQQQFPYTSK